MANRTRMGRPISVEDAQIAAIALANDLALAARNTADFEHIERLVVVNPWVARVQFQARRQVEQQCEVNVSHRPIKQPNGHLRQFQFEHRTMNKESNQNAPIRTPQTDEVLRRIGRNLVLFQQVERLLKHLIAHADISAPASQLQVQLEEQIATVNTQTMGGLATLMRSKVLREKLLPERDDADEADEADEAPISVRFSIVPEAQFADLHDHEMRTLVDARNELVHHFLPRWQGAVEGDVENAINYLDAQRDLTLRIQERLVGMVKARVLMAEYSASPEVVRAFELEWLQKSRLVEMFREVAVLAPRADGWTLLSKAANFIRSNDSGEIDDFQERFGHKSLKQLLIASELFDVTDEPLANGETRTIYRAKKPGKLKPQ